MPDTFSLFSLCHFFFLEHSSPEPHNSLLYFHRSWLKKLIIFSMKSTMTSQFKTATYVLYLLFTLLCTLPGHHCDMYHLPAYHVIHCTMSVVAHLPPLELKVHKNRNVHMFCSLHIPVDQCLARNRYLTILLNE